LAFNSPAVGKKSIKYIFAQFLTGLRKFTNNGIYENPAENWEMTVFNQIGDKGIQFDADDLQEIANKGSSFDIENAIETWVKTIAWLGMAAKDYPFNQMLQIIENGTSSTPLTALGINDTIVALDGQPLFSASHSYDSASGSLTNIQTGTGVDTITKLEIDLLGLVGKLQSMSYGATGAINGEKRLLNQNITSVKIHCPALLKPQFEKMRLSNSVSALNGGNVVASALVKEVMPHPFTDANDWYVEVLDAETPFMRPFMLQEVYAPRLDTPSMKDYSVVNNNKLQYGVRVKLGVGLAGFWKMGKVTNT